MDIDIPLYRPCVGIVLLHPLRNDLVFAGERLSPAGAWQMPQGGIDDNETIEQAAFRELKEETGTNKASLLQILSQPLRYTLPDDAREKLWNGKYAGQDQYWVFLRFLGEDKDFVLDADAHQEFVKWSWLSPNDMLDRIVSFKKETYKKVFKELADLSL